MFRPRLVNTINRRFQDALTTRKHLKVFYKQKIMLNQIKFQLKTNSRVKEPVSRASQGHWDSGIPSPPSFSGLAPAQRNILKSIGQNNLCLSSRSQDIDIGKMLKIIPAEPCCFKWGN